MVEFREAEALAHESESYLRALQKGTATLTDGGIQALIDGNRLFDRLIENLRKGEPAPDISLLLPRLTELAGGGSTVGGAGGHQEPAVSRVTFTPWPDLQERGVTVNTVRQRLEAAAEILEVTPQVSPGGAVRFDFVIRGRVEPATLDAWAKDGITFEAAAPPPDAAPPAASSGPVAAAAQRTHYVRVDLARLDDLMRLIADVVITRARLQ